ncbi:hypothetical protein ACQUE6_08495 [Enterococcus casseliflavus]|uniref:hypothetical protein n=1 Tax=Enterococcus casseliflavus TaxID=37734 RepID=UPI003D13A98E
MFDFWVIALFAVGCWSSFRWLRLQLNKPKNAKYSFHVSLLTPVIVIPSLVTMLPALALLFIIYSVLLRKPIIVIPSLVTTLPRVA